jgi:CRISPR/Cas system-associated exonuclease Cas4 (RecB family)
MGSPETPPQLWGGTSSEESPIEQLQATISNQDFTDWYHERQVEKNILQGQAYFNGPSPPKSPERHAPNKLRQCHRKTWYNRLNAPEEDTTPEGLFRFGTDFEENVIVPYLQDRTPEGTYVQNSIWIDCEIPTGDTTLQVRGSTDPAIVTADADPLLVTEVKTTSSLDHISKPKPHHLAQLHSYLYALDDEYDHPVEHGVLLYGSRDTLDIKLFPVTFDEDVWATGVEWLSTQTKYQSNNELPPPDPEIDWECSYCSYRNRCGKAETPYSDIGAEGLLPLFDAYDRRSLEDYLEAYADAGAKVTPTLAHKFSDLVDSYGAYEWSCVACSSTFRWDDVDWSGDTDEPPLCPDCVDTGDFVLLSGPEPENQLSES